MVFVRVETFLPEPTALCGNFIRNKSEYGQEKPPKIKKKKTNQTKARKNDLPALKNFLFVE